LRQQPPSGRVGRDRPGQCLLVSRYCQVSDGLATVSEHPGEIDRDAARVVPALPLPANARLKALAKTGRVARPRSR
jgi:hypothetical protein